GGADERGRFRIDQPLIERFGRDTDPVGDIGEFQFPEELEEGRLVKSHRALCPYVEIPRQFSLTIARWLTHVYDADQPIGISTTPRDVTVRADQWRVRRRKLASDRLRGRRRTDD